VPLDSAELDRYDTGHFHELASTRPTGDDRTNPRDSRLHDSEIETRAQLRAARLGVRFTELIQSAYSTHFPSRAIVRA
jgi:hypothetical protein